MRSLVPVVFSRVFPAAQFRRVIPLCRPQHLYPQNLQHLHQKVRREEKCASVFAYREKIMWDGSIESVVMYQILSMETEGRWFTNDTCWEVLHGFILILLYR